MLKIAHRGFSQNFKDNSIESFLGAIKENFDMIELDIQLSKDDIIIINHDIYKNSKLLIDYTLVECRKEEIITLLDFFHLIEKNKKDIKVYLDIKGDIACGIFLYNFLKNHKNILDSKNIYVASFNRETLKPLFKLKKELPINIGFITCSSYLNSEYDIILKNYDFLSVCWTVLNERTVNYCKNNNIKIFAFTCENYFILNYMKKFNIDGIVSNFIFY
tara:strand:+ start:601 stop:1254 length:654 start_codon:yes stop_codon:yes gene_type:complete